MIKREHYLNQIIDLIDKDIIKILTGVRRSGKSVLLYIIVIFSDVAVSDPVYYIMIFFIFCPCFSSYFNTLF